MVDAILSFFGQWWTRNRKRTEMIYERKLEAFSSLTAVLGDLKRGAVTFHFGRRTAGELLRDIDAVGAAYVRAMFLMPEHLVARTERHIDAISNFARKTTPQVESAIRSGRVPEEFSIAFRELNISIHDLVNLLKNDLGLNDSGVNESFHPKAVKAENKEKKK